MTFIKALLIAVSTYSALPVPQFEWSGRSMRYSVCFFPAVGLLCGAVLWGWSLLCAAVGAGALVFASVAVCLPLLISGGIHMDGYMDTVDALSARTDRARRLEILKDPHCGAFAVIYCGIYLLLSLGLFAELYRLGRVAAYCPIYVFSRALSAFCALRLPNARGSGMLHAYTEKAAKGVSYAALAVTAVCAAAACVLISPSCGAAAAAAALLVLPLYRRLALRSFGGVTGDTAGFFLQLCELAALLGAWLGAAV